MGFERNYQLKIPSKQLIVKKFSTFKSSPVSACWRMLARRQQHAPSLPGFELV